MSLMMKWKMWEYRLSNRKTQTQVEMGNCPLESNKRPSMKKSERLYYSDYCVSTKTQKEEAISKF